MRNDDHPTGKQTQSDKPFLSIIEAAVDESDTRSGQDLLRILEIEAVFGEVAAVLRLVPFIYYPTQYLRL